VSCVSSCAVLCAVANSNQTVTLRSMWSALDAQLDARLQLLKGRDWLKDHGSEMMMLLGTYTIAWVSVAAIAPFGDACIVGQAFSVNRIAPHGGLFSRTSSSWAGNGTVKHPCGISRRLW
jgi:hypothetical protein